MTGALLPIDNEVYTALLETRIDNLPAPVIEIFTKSGILVSSSRDELSELEHEIDIRSSGKNPETGEFYRVLTTTTCNAACPYCYEKNLPVQTMKDETAHSTSSFIQKTVMNNKPYIEWFGGEPLMNSRAISLICHDLENSGISFFSKITTNGSLWTDKIILEASDKWNLRSVQITLDGINEEHERIKGLPQSSFRRIIRSIHKLADINIRVRIRINHYEGQEHLHFVHWLAKEFSGKPDISAYVTPGYRAGKEYSETLMKEVLNLNLYLKDAGLIYQSGKFLPRRIHTGCFACNPHIASSAAGCMS